MDTVCYVCHEPTEAQCQCACAAFVHPKCLLKFVQASNYPCCSICKTPIANVRERPPWRRLSRVLRTGSVVLKYPSTVCAILSLLMTCIVGEARCKRALGSDTVDYILHFDMAVSFLPLLFEFCLFWVRSYPTYTLV